MPRARVGRSGRDRDPWLGFRATRPHHARPNAVGITLVLSVVGTAIIAFALKFAMGGLRPSADVETAGLDISEHGEEAYIS